MNALLSGSKSHAAIGGVERNFERKASYDIERTRNLPGVSSERLQRTCEAFEELFSAEGSVTKRNVNQRSSYVYIVQDSSHITRLMTRRMARAI